MDWQPIETAPKDETWVLLYFPESERKVQAGFWGDPPDWYDGEAASKSLTAFGEHPTHWMPLPAPPSVE